MFWPKNVLKSCFSTQNALKWPCVTPNMTLQENHPVKFRRIRCYHDQIFSGFTELTFFHSFTDIPVNECSLGVHEVEFVIESSPSLGDGGGVAQHANSSLHFGQVSAWNDGWWLVVDTDFESGWRPVNELDGSFGLDDGDGGVDAFWNDITSV